MNRYENMSKKEIYEELKGGITIRNEEERETVLKAVGAFRGRWIKKVGDVCGAVLIGGGFWAMLSILNIESIEDFFMVLSGVWNEHPDVIAVVLIYIVYFGVVVMEE